MTGNGITGTPLKVLLHRAMHQLGRLTRMVLVPTKQPEMRLASFGTDRTLTVDAAEGLFSRDGKTIALFSVKPARVHLSPTTPNRDRVKLYAATGRNGLRIFYYRTDTNWFVVASGDSLVRIQRDDIAALRQAIRKFTRTARPDLTRKPGKAFSEYAPP